MKVKARSDDPTQVFPSEDPQYPELARAVNAAWRETERAFGELRTDWFEAVGLEEKALGGDILRGVGRIIERFLRVFAGGDRSQRGFTDPNDEDGILQQAILLGAAAGRMRVTTQLGPGNPAFTEAQRARLLSDAFQRLTVDGRFRFETRLGEIRDAMAQGFRDGENPLSIARRLGRDLDGYERGRLRTIVRTEMAFASERAILDMGSLRGVVLWDVLGDPTTDDACVEAQNGGPYTTGQMIGMLPVHPQCFCSAAPHTE